MFSRSKIEIVWIIITRLMATWRRVFLSVIYCSSISFNYVRSIKKRNAFDLVKKIVQGNESSSCWIWISIGFDLKGSVREFDFWNLFNKGLYKVLFFERKKRLKTRVIECCSSWNSHFFPIHERVRKSGFFIVSIDCTSKFLPIH